MNQLGELGYQIWDVEFGDHTSAIDRESKSLLISGYLELGNEALIIPLQITTPYFI